MRVKTLFLALSLAAIGCAQETTLFTPDERDSVLRYWSRPDRYTTTVPADALRNGVWQVRLTVPGSTWLWNYQKGKKIPPTQDVRTDLSDEQRQWEAWVAARIARDRYQAWQTAQRANREALGKAVPVADATVPATEPADPGPIPAGLLAAVGNPPPFAEAVAPLQHEVVFDDVTLRYEDNIRTGSPRYAFYRYAQGVISFGSPVKNLPKSDLDRLFGIARVSEAEARVMRAVSLLEGGFDSINTYDTGYVSVGFIQFACLKEGGGSLGAVLRQLKQDDPAAFQATFRNFGLDVTPDGKLAALDLATGAELTGPAAAQEIIDDKRLIAVFQRAGQKSEPFLAAQIQTAKNLYFPGEDAVSILIDGRTLTGKVSDIVKSEAGLATLMDRKVNTGKIDPLPAILNTLAAQIRPTTLADLAAYERDIIAAVKYRKDYLADPSLSQPAAAPARRVILSSRKGQGRRGRSGRGQ